MEALGGHQWNSRNVPAGTVVDPGSQVLYIVDTGVNLREEAGNESGDTELLNAKWGDPLEITKPELFSGGELAAGAISQSFIAITNTHPTAAVTVHFRYFNDECEDLLDFLVLLTCNDTLIFDPFNFIVPETSSNTRNRIFGPASGILTPISSRQFASGRFLIFATASGTSTNYDDDAEILFPNEFKANHFTGEEEAATSDCGNLRSENYYGSNPGIRDSNLHVFNANAVAFNYLIGAQTWAELVSEQGATPIAQAWGLNAWTRPAVDGDPDHYAEDINYDTDISELGLRKLSGSGNRRGGGRRHPDADGQPLLNRNDFRILGGGEALLFSQDSKDRLHHNHLILRAELHAGDTARWGMQTDLPLRQNNIAEAGFRQRQGPRTNTGDGNAPDFSSWWGALGTPSIFGIDPEDQVMNFLSMMDDYNGSGTSFGGAFANDNSYNVGQAETTYVLQIYDQNEQIYDISPDPDPNISPFPEQSLVTLKITVDCLRVWVTDVKIPSTSVDDLSIADLQKITEEDQGPVGWLTKDVDPLNDASQGWIRFVRDNTQDGTWESYTPGGGDADSTPYHYGVFVTIAYQAIVQGGLGSAWWLATVASDPWVSATGDPTCNDACPNGARRSGGSPF